MFLLLDLCVFYQEPVWAADVGVTNAKPLPDVESNPNATDSSLINFKSKSYSLN